ARRRGTTVCVPLAGHDRNCCCRLCSFLLFALALLRPVDCSQDCYWVCNTFAAVAWLAPGNCVLLLEAGLQIFQVYRGARLSAFGRSSEILHRPGNWSAQFTSGAQWKIRISKHLTRDDHRVGLPGANDVLRLSGRY